MSNVTNTIMDQLRWQGLDRLALIGLGLRMLVKIDDNTLRLHFKRRKGVINVDIHYNEGTDLYDVKVHRLHPRTLEVKTKEHNGIFFDQFADIFSEEVAR